MVSLMLLKFVKLEGEEEAVVFPAESSEAVVESSEAAMSD